jgi:hypothetical protein
MKMMVWPFVSNPHKVMTALIVILPSKCWWWRSQPLQCMVASFAVSWCFLAQGQFEMKPSSCSWSSTKDFFYNSYALSASQHYGWVFLLLLKIWQQLRMQILLSPRMSRLWDSYLWSLSGADNVGGELWRLVIALHDEGNGLMLCELFLISILSSWLVYKNPISKLERTLCLLCSCISSLWSPATRLHRATRGFWSFLPQKMLGLVGSSLKVQCHMIWWYTRQW